MAASYGGALTRSTSWNTSSLTATSTGRTAGQLLVALFGNKPYSATINTLSGWAAGGTIASGTGADWDMRATVFTRVCDTTETNTWTSSTTVSPYTAQVLYFNKGAGETWQVTTTTVADTNSAGTSISLNAGNLGLQAGDLLVEATYGPQSSNPSGASLSIPGCTFTRSVKDFGGTALGSDIGWVIDVVEVTAGSQTGDLVLTYNGGSGFSQSAATFTRIRAVVAIPSGSTTGDTTYTGSATGEMPAVLMEGSASGDVTVTGSSTGDRASAGAATGQAEFTGSSVGSIALSGSATGQVDYSGSVAGDRLEYGEVTNVINWPTQLGYFQYPSGTVVGQRPTNNSATGSFSIVGAEASGEHPPPNFGSAGGDLTITATTFGKHQKRGSVFPGDSAPGEGLLTYTGVATGSRPSVVGTITFTGSAQGEMPSGSSVTGSYSLDGSATGTRTSAANAVGSHSYSGTSAGTRTSSGAASGEYVYTGSAQTSQVVGSVVGSYLYVGSADGFRVSSGSVAGGVTFTGSGSGARTSSGAVTGGVTVTVVAAVGRNDIRNITITIVSGPNGHALAPNLQPRRALSVGYPQQRELRIRSKNEAAT